jgi:hypothetical protein
VDNGTQRPAAVQYNVRNKQLMIRQLDISNPEIVLEAHHWAAGCRGPAVTGDRLAEVDLSVFVRAALDAGTKAIQAAAGTTAIASQHRAVADLAQRAEDASRKAVNQIERAADHAEKAAKASGDETRRVVSQTAEQMRGTMRSTLDQAVSDLRREITALTGENAPVAAAARAAVDKAGIALQSQLEQKLEDAIASIGRKFDLRDPTSPIGHLATSLREEQGRLAAQVTAGHDDLARRLDHLQTSIATTAAAARAAEHAARVTPLKGTSFEDAVHEAVGKLARAWGDEYTNTAQATGLISRCMKGDGVLTILGQPRAPEGIRVVVEMSDSDSARREWVAYLDECERNRGARAALGIVRNPAQVPGGGRIRIFGSSRMVIAFDPEIDEPDTLQTVLLLLRLQAVLATSRSGVAHVRTAEEKIGEATATLGQLAELQNTATIARSNADKIVTGLGGLHSRLTRALAEASHALQAAATEQQTSKSGASAA